MEETSPNINYLTRDILVALNAEQIFADIECTDKRFAGKVHNEGSLDYLIEIVKDDRIFPSIEEKASQYCYRIITDHIFFDANKRCGWSSVFVFAKKNNAYFKRFSDKFLERTAIAIADKTMGHDDFVKIIKARIQFKKRRC